VLCWLLLNLADGLLVVLQQLIDLLDLLIHLLDLSGLGVLVLGALIVRVILLIFWIWRLLAFLKVHLPLSLVLGLLVSTLLLILVLLWLWWVMPESRLITCNKLAPKPVKEVIDVEEGGASLGLDLCLNLTWHFCLSRRLRVGGDLSSLKGLLASWWLRPFYYTALTDWIGLCKHQIAALRFMASLFALTFLLVCLVREVLVLWKKCIDWLCIRSA